MISHYANAINDEEYAAPQEHASVAGDDRNRLAQISIALRTKNREFLFQIWAFEIPLMGL